MEWQETNQETNSEIWTIEEPKVRVKIGEETVLEKEQITAEDIIRIAKERKLAKFIVKDAEGNLLRKTDFPVTPEKTTEIVIEPYSEGA